MIYHYYSLGQMEMSGNLSKQFFSSFFFLILIYQRPKPCVGASGWPAKLVLHVSVILNEVYIVALWLFLSSLINPQWQLHDQTNKVVWINYHIQQITSQTTKFSPNPLFWVIIEDGNMKYISLDQVLTKPFTMVYNRRWEHETYFSWKP